MNQSQYDLLRRDVLCWNAWRKMSPDEQVDLCGADLQETDLYGANLREANLREANLYRANLLEADLYGANLYGANLYGANLYAVNLYGANLHRANLFEADLRGAKHIWHCGPGGSRGDMLYAVMWDDGIHFFTGCFAGTEAKLLAFVEEQHGNSAHGQYYRAMVAAAKAWAEAYEMEDEQ